MVWLFMSNSTEHSTPPPTMSDLSHKPTFCDYVKATRKAPAEDGLSWFAVKTTSHGEQRLADHLRGQGIEYFYPIRVDMDGERKVRRPAISGLVFIRTTPQRLIEEQIRYGLERMFIYFERPTNHPLVVPDSQMVPFILVSSTEETQLEYIENRLLESKRGDRVRVIAGQFEGAEGRVVRIKSNRRLVIDVEGIAAIVTHHIPSYQLQKIE